jgi:hypothetical protein
MAIIQISQIQQRSGNLADLPQLNEAQFGWATDTKQLFIGKTTPPENIEVLTSYSSIAFDQILGAQGNLNITGTLSTGEILAYDGNNWINAGGTAGGVINLGNVSNVHIGGGAIGYVLQTDGAGNLSWTAQTGGGGGGGTPGGSNTAVQYNASGVFGASSSFTYNYASSILTVNGNINTGNINASSAVSASTFNSNVATGTPPLTVQSTTRVANLNATLAGTVTTAAQPNITSIGTLISLTVANTGSTGNIVADNANLGNLAKANFFQGDGHLLTNISVAAGSYIVNGTSNAALATNGNFTVQVNGITNILQVSQTGTTVQGYLNASTLGGSLTTGTQPNITSVGTLTSLSVTGSVSTGNITSTGLVTGNGAGLSGLVGSNVTGQVAYAAVANSVAGANVSGQVNYAAVAYSVAGTNVIGQVAYANIANSVAGANVVGQVAYAAVANSVSGGNVTGQVAYAAVANSVAAANVVGTVANANYSTYSGTAGVANSVAGANVTGTVANATTAGNVSHGVFFNNSGTGAISGTGYDGTSTTTISYNTLGALGPSNFTGSNQALTTTGYQKLPGGLIMQWGTLSAQSDSSYHAVTFAGLGAIAFPTACLNIQLQPYQTVQDSSITGATTTAVAVQGLTATGFNYIMSSNWNIGGTTGVPLYWFAIGH